MADVKDILNIGFGVLNPVRDTLVGNNFSTSNVKTMDALVESASRSFSSNASLGTGPFVGICLRFDGYLSDGAIDPSVWANVINSTFRDQDQSSAPRLSQIRVRIPELHASLPVPNELPSSTEESPEHAIINMYPVFLAKDIQISSDTPQPGDLVWVDFQNTNTLEGPIYLGRVTSDVSINSNSTTSGRESFKMVCKQVPALDPPSSQPIKNSNSQQPPSIGPQLEESYTPKPKTPAKKQTITVCGPVATNAGVNQNYLGLPKDYQPTGRVDYSRADPEFLGALSSVGNTGKRKLKIEMIILHDGGMMAGRTTKNVVNMWMKKKASSHYFVELDGTVYQLEEEARVAWHAGGGPVPKVNGRSIGIDLQRCREKGSKHKFEDKAGNKYDCDSRNYRRPYSKQQLKALKNLLEDITRRQGIPYDEEHIVAHGAIYQGNHADPVKGFDWSEINLTNKFGPSDRGKFAQAPNPSSSGTAVASANPEVQPQATTPAEVSLAEDGTTSTSDQSYDIPPLLAL